MRIAPIAMALAVLSLPVSAHAEELEIRTCGQDLRIAPVNDARAVQSLVLQSFSVVNSGTRPVALDRIELALLGGGEARELRILSRSEIDRALAAGPRIAGLAQVIPSQFCNGRLMANARAASGSDLAPGEGVVFLQQVFVWSGPRETLRISTGGASANLTIDAAPARTQALYPLAGRSFAATGPTLHGHHRWLALQEFAYDIAMLGNGRTYKAKGTRPQDYLVYGQPVRAVASGIVASVRSDRPDSTELLQRPGESDAAYAQRSGEEQAKLLAQGFEAVLGNHIVIDHGNGEFSVYAHLKPGSIAVAPGDRIERGARIGAVGTSGNSSQPHLHFQMSDCADVKSCRSIPVNFTAIRLTVDQTQRAVQSGDLIETVE